MRTWRKNNREVLKGITNLFLNWKAKSTSTIKTWSIKNLALKNKISRKMPVVQNLRFLVSWIGRKRRRREEIWKNSWRWTVSNPKWCMSTSSNRNWKIPSIRKIESGCSQTWFRKWTASQCTSSTSTTKSRPKTFSTSSQLKTRSSSNSKKPAREESRISWRDSTNWRTTKT